MKLDTKSVGNIGEKIAMKYLELKEWLVVSQNFAKQFGEIDLVAITTDKTLVFIEVKTMFSRPGGLMPEDQLSSAKLKKLKRIAQFFVNQHPELIDEDKGWRIDLVAVLLERADPAHEGEAQRNPAAQNPAKTKTKWKAKIRHYEGIG